MGTAESGLVDIVRDFLAADQLMRSLFARHRRNELRFEEVAELVGDGESSVLYRLKEHCHALFRPRDGASDVRMRREALFDLAVGSLFHEAMKFRENLYQQTVYGPKVRALRSSAGPDSDELFREFEKILSAASVRLDEAVLETEALLHQTREQLRVLLVAHRENGLVTRYLVENASLASEVFLMPFDRLLAEIHGDAAEGYALAARSYLASGYFAEGHRALDEAMGRAGERPDLRRLAAYAGGMAAYLGGDYEQALARLAEWLEGGPPAEEAPFADLAWSAVGRVNELVEGPGAAELARRAAELARRLAPLSPRARAAA